MDSAHSAGAVDEADCFSTDWRHSAHRSRRCCRSHVSYYSLLIGSLLGRIKGLARPSACLSPTGTQLELKGQNLKDQTYPDHNACNSRASWQNWKPRSPAVAREGRPYRVSEGQQIIFVPCERAYATSYYCSIGTLTLSLTISKIRPVFRWKTQIFPTLSSQLQIWKCSPALRLPNFVRRQPRQKAKYSCKKFSLQSTR